MRPHLSTALMILALAIAAPALAQEFKAGDITIDNSWARATPKGAEVGAGYFVVHNTGETSDRLTGGAADFAKVEVHEMKTENGVMTMPELKNGLDIPAHGTIRFSPGGYHLMFAHLGKPLVKGETVKVTLSFERVGQIAVEFPVGGLGASGPATNSTGGGRRPLACRPCAISLVRRAAHDCTALALCRFVHFTATTLVFSSSAFLSLYAPRKPPQRWW